ncbi:hypothetical protein VTN02DRAFT_5994 [Thermoascus thermophilus]
MSSGTARNGARISGSSSQHGSSLDHIPAPPYSEIYGEVDLNHGGFDSNARITDDGRININISEGIPGWSSVRRSALHFQPPARRPPSLYIPPSLSGGGKAPPPLNVVIHVVGSRGDVQPFIALGQILKTTYGHRVRLATHPTFKNFVEENGLEFFSIGGDPAQLMEFMVKNPGLIPGRDAMKSGEISKRRHDISTIISGCWRSCFEAGDGMGVPVSDATLHNGSFSDAAPFVADVIIANPPSFAHIHCAEKLGIPLHLMFTMPWSPTQAFPHPLANIQSSNADVSVTNRMTYLLVEMMTWQGLGDIINKFRERNLGLEPVSIMWAPTMITRLRIPYTYCWSPALIPKPSDWGNHIDISGFFFLSLGSNYTPPDDLAAFLAAGPPPVYIGFGSIVVDDPNEMTKMIFEAVRKTGQRALVSKGWGGLGAEEFDIPDGVFILGNCPHDWLFQRVSCVVHHGGAGTTAAGLALGKPTVIIPFFGDQPFWGSMVAKAGAGPTPIPYSQLTADKLADAIMEALQPAALEKARELGAKIRREKGAETGGKSFHKQLHVDDLRCRLAPGRAAAFRVRRTDVRLSALAVAVLINEGLLDLNNLKLYRSKEYDTEPEPQDPITGGGVAMIGNIGDWVMGFADVPHEIKRGLKNTPAHTHSSGSSISQSPPQAAASESSASAQSRLSVQSAGSSQQSVGHSNGSRTSVAEESGRSGIDGAGSETASNSRHSSRHGGTEFRRGSTSEGHRRSSSVRGADTDAASNPVQTGLETALKASRIATKLFNMSLRAPMDFTLAISKGFHNAPRLYGDDTVREAHRVTGIKSGFKAAGKELGYGFYDGISGLATQPLAGARKGGAAGAIKGFGKGIGGLALKPAAGVWGLTGYTMSGIYKQIQKHFGEHVENYIIASRCAQGAEDYAHSTPEEQADILNRWHAIQPEIQKQKESHEFRRLSRGSELENSHGKQRKEQNGTSDMASQTQSFRDLLRSRNGSPMSRHGSTS